MTADATSIRRDTNELVVGYPKPRPTGHDESSGLEAATANQIDAYRTLVAPIYQRFRDQLSGRLDPEQKPQSVDAPGPNVGLLTFPNSGTSWFARVACVATGICRHTVYRQESRDPVPSRGFYALHPRPNAALPATGDPVLVKSHVRFFAGGRNERVANRTMGELVGEWEMNLPEVERSIRLVRNPVDNLRARYHHYLRKVQSGGGEAISFADFLTTDVTNYLLWHECCDLAVDSPLLTIDYDRLLSGEPEPFQVALNFVGYRVTPEDVERALKLHPPKYQSVSTSHDPESQGLPVHLRYYSVSDLRWLGAELQSWLESRLS